MRPDKKMHGFSLLCEEYIAEAGANLYTMTHAASGARLAFLDREDENMTFAIAFRTPPSNDTGVFHIIEHSVLCGSRKFPLKEPFVDLLKGSLNTFLNALTYEDRTVYPISSRCERDFLNLTDVYLDAVFHPKMLENENVFLGEGWHYEYDSEANRLSYNGVVYNEMCGAYSSPDDLAAAEISRALYSGTIYGYDSGGNPSFIPDLSYAELKAAHEKYYHPSNSYIYLDGSINLEPTLALIDSYLSEYERREPEKIENVYLPTHGREVTVKYEIPEGESEDGRARVVFGYSHSDFSDMKAALGTLVLSDVLTGSNESLLKKYLLDLALCEDVSMYNNRAERQTLTIEVKGVREENIERVKSELDSLIRSIAAAGIDKERLVSTVNIIEFKEREREYGAFPIGVANALSVFSVWPYGDKPSRALVYEELLAEIRSAIDAGYFEELLAKITVNNPHSARVIMLPDKQAVADFQAEMQTRLDKVLENCSEKELSVIIETERKLKEYQTSEDSDEARATLPTLSLSEIKKDKRAVPKREYEAEGCRVISHDVPVGKISYVSLYFDARDLEAEQLAQLAVLSTLITNIPTENESVVSLRNRIKANLGGFTVAPSVLPNIKDGTDFTPVISVSTSALDSKRGNIPEIISEVLTRTVYEDTDALKILLTQTVRSLEEGMIADGAGFALGRVAGMLNSFGAAKEYLSGCESYRIIKNMLSEEDAGTLMDKLKALAKRLFVRERMTVSVIGEDTDSTVREVISVIPSGEAVTEKGIILPIKKQSEGFAIPSRVGYAALGSAPPADTRMLGVLRVVRSILSYEHLWGAVRIVGGAYGTGFVTGKGGSIAYYSYRDPSPKGALEAFRASAAFLRELALSGRDLTAFIIGAFGEYDILTTPRSAAVESTYNTLTGWTDEDEAELREALLSTTHSDLIRAAELLEQAAEGECVSVFAGRDMLLGIEELCENIRDI